MVQNRKEVCMSTDEKRGSFSEDRVQQLNDFLLYIIQQLQIITSRKHVTKHFRMAKKYCAQWQLKGNRCLTHDLCAIFVEFTQRDNLSSKLLSFMSSLYNRPLFCHTDAEDNGDNQE